MKTFAFDRRTVLTARLAQLYAKAPPASKDDGATTAPLDETAVREACEIEAILTELEKLERH